SSSRSTSSIGIVDVSLDPAEIYTVVNPSGIVRVVFNATPGDESTVSINTVSFTIGNVAGSFVWDIYNVGGVGSYTFTSIGESITRYALGVPFTIIWNGFGSLLFDIDFDVIASSQSSISSLSSLSSLNSSSTSSSKSLNSSSSSVSTPSSVANSSSNSSSSPANSSSSESTPSVSTVSSQSANSSSNSSSSPANSSSSGSTTSASGSSRSSSGSSGSSMSSETTGVPVDNSSSSLNSASSGSSESSSQTELADNSSSSSPGEYVSFGYDLEPVDGAGSDTNIVTPAGSTGSLTISNLVRTGLGGSTSAATAWGCNGFESTNASLQDALNTPEGFFFSVSSTDTDKTFTISSCLGPVLSRSSTGPSNIALVYSFTDTWTAGNYTTVASVSDIPSTTSTSSSSATDYTSVFNAALGSAPISVPGSTTVYFRLVAWGASSTAGILRFFDAITTGDEIDYAFYGYLK
ncbi:MAG: hypothetical protein M0R32_09555, partial [Candidatus Cloacimonetes bacterium]|nr:hypothetical protein [Candidatus Cloacimonadota bacterium]